VDLARLRELRDRIRAGHPLSAADGAEFDTEIGRLTDRPEETLIRLVSGISAETARSLERADQAHDRSAEAHTSMLAAVGRLEPVLARLAIAEAARVEAEVERIRQENARRDKLFGGVGMALEAAVKSGWAKILGAGLAGWFMSKVTLWLTP
jgi:hypothetical protein